jgi:LysM repeat protein
MSNDSDTSFVICPTCGTRASKKATTCLVCGASLSSSPRRSQKVSEQPIEITQMPTITFSAPVIILILIIMLVVGGGGTYLALNLSGSIAEPEDTPTLTSTPLPTLTPTVELPTIPPTALPSPTPLTYQVQSDDTCLEIAYIFNISVQSIVVENGLSADCGLSVGTTLRIPHPTPTNTPLATNTPSSQQATVEACEKTFHVVQENETLSLISTFYEVPVEYIMEWSGKSVDTAFLGETLTIPMCLRSSIAGATVTPSPAPEYPAPELLRPRNGEAFTQTNNTITLQWAAVSDLRENEYYLVSVIDITEGENQELTTAVKDTKFIVPESLQPEDDLPHIFRWSVVSVAQIGVNEDGTPRYREGGPSSQSSYFTWVGALQSTPQP